MRYEATDDWISWAETYGRYSANRRNRPRGGLRETGEQVGMTKQGVKHRVDSLEREARRMGYIAARSAAFRSLLLQELLTYSGEPWFETYSGGRVDRADLAVDELVQEIRLAHAAARSRLD